MFICRFREEWSSSRKTDQQKLLFCKLACRFQTGPTTVARMTTFIKIFSLVFAYLLTITLPIRAGTPEQEKAFVDKYKTAFEGKDRATLESFLYTQGADSSAVEFYKMTQSGEAGEKISKIELVAISPAGRVTEEPDRYRPRMPKNLRQAFDFLESAVVKDPEVADLILSAHKALAQKKQ